MSTRRAFSDVRWPISPSARPRMRELVRLSMERRRRVPWRRLMLARRANGGSRRRASAESQHASAAHRARTTPSNCYRVAVTRRSGSARLPRRQIGARGSYQDDPAGRFRCLAAAMRQLEGGRQLAPLLRRSQTTVGCPEHGDGASTYRETEREYGDREVTGDDG